MPYEPRLIVFTLPREYPREELEKVLAKPPRGCVPATILEKIERDDFPLYSEYLVDVNKEDTELAWLKHCASRRVYLPVRRYGCKKVVRGVRAKVKRQFARKY